MNTVSYQTTKDSTTIQIDDHVFRVANHWFWKQFPEWEPETFEFYKRYCEPGSHVLDMGAWIGPTALIALANGASRVTMVEPNPATLEVLESTCKLDGLLNSSWSIIPRCISNRKGSVSFGMPDGNMRSSSAASIRGTCAQVETITIPDIISQVGMKSVSLIKIDIEGSEDDIIHDLLLFVSYNAPIWLSLHPPFVSDLELYSRKFEAVYMNFYVLDSNLTPISIEQLQHRILSMEPKPTWGTEFGNFFEIALLPKQNFDLYGNRITPWAQS